MSAGRVTERMGVFCRGNLLETLFWHDYETFGTDPARDRPAQFAGLRTDTDLNPVAEPVSFFCRPADDALPHPGACLVTHITPQHCQREGLSEAEFASRVLAELGQSGTCGVGYNSIRFDDEVTRHLLFRNLIDPYAREWQNGGSRWDLIDVVRLAYATRPEGIEWPLQEGLPSFRLEAMTAANGLAHESAHDALSDVEATLDLARLLKQAQPRLFQYAYDLRRKQKVRELIDLAHRKPLFHVSSKIPARLGCCALVAPLAVHPKNPNAILMLDLRADPKRWQSLSVEQIRERLFTRSEDLAEGEERIPVKAVHLNRAPVLVTPKLLSSVPAERLKTFELDGDRLRENLATLRASGDFAEKIAAAFDQEPEGEKPDPEFSLYNGAFLSDGDRRLLDEIRRMDPESLSEQSFPFADARLETLVFRYRGRSFPDTFSEAEMARWEAYRVERLTGGLDSQVLTFEKFFAELESLANQHANHRKNIQLLQELQWYAESLVPGY